MSGLDLAGVLSIYERWLYLPDPDAPVAVLGATAANNLAGGPVWLLIVGPSGGGTTELLQSIGLRDIHQVATLQAGAPPVHVLARIREGNIRAAWPAALAQREGHRQRPAVDAWRVMILYANVCVASNVDRHPPCCRRHGSE
jgi:hypothetical protein